MKKIGSNPFPTIYCDAKKLAEDYQNAKQEVRSSMNEFELVLIEKFFFL